MESGEYYNASLWEYTADDLECIHLQSIMVRKDAPKGIGTEFMRKLSSLADSHGKWITLDLGSRGDSKSYTAKGRRGSGYKTTTSSDRLKRWYSSLGFKRNASKGLFQLRGSMHRPPKGKYPW
jgi:hypothetical protein